MLKKEKIRAIYFIILTITIYFFISFSINYINKNTTNSITLNNGVLNGNLINDNLYIINNFFQDSNEKSFYIDTNQNLSLVVHNLYYPYKLILNGEEISNKNYSYNKVSINKGLNQIELIGKGVEHTFFFISTIDKMKDYLDIRFLVNTFLLFFHLVVFLGCLFVLNVSKNTKLVFIFLIYVFSSFFKGINLGEIPILIDLFKMNIYSYDLIDRITTAINNVVPIYILLKIFEINIKKIYKIILLLCAILLTLFSHDILIKFQIWHLFVSIILLIVTFLILLFGFINKKKATLAIIILRTLFFVLTLSYLKIIQNRIVESNLIFFCNYAYLGASIYFLGISIFVVIYYIKYNNELVKKEKEYERVMLLKGIGHDLKHPVLIAKLNNQYLLESDLNEDEKDSVQISLDALSRLDKMIENINIYFNKRNEIRVGEEILLKEALKEIEYSYKKQKNLLLNVDYQNSNCLININSLNFYRIIENLIDNAIKFNSEDIILYIFCEIDKNFVLINIEDNGKGFEKKEIEKIFNLFYRCEESHSIEGLGIGLSVVKQLVESSKGKIFVKSQKDRGTRFTLKFPIKK